MSEWEFMDLAVYGPDIDLLAIEWHVARLAFLALPSGSPNARSALERLANAENALSKAVAEKIKRDEDGIL